VRLLAGVNDVIAFVLELIMLAVLRGADRGQLQLSLGTKKPNGSSAALTTPRSCGVTATAGPPDRRPGPLRRPTAARSGLAAGTTSANEDRTGAILLP
jgi:hypothetical protein